jgi:predicted nucleic acid-binding Zn ribbon protein
VEPLRTILPDVLRGLNLERGTAGWRAVMEWSTYAGERIARHAHAARFHDGEMTIEVEGSAWMHELGYLERELVQRANQHVGADVVRRLRFVRARGGNPR